MFTLPSQKHLVLTKFYTSFFLGLALLSCAPSPSNENTQNQESEPDTQIAEELNEEVSRSVLDPLFDFGSEEMLALAFGKENLTRKMEQGPEGTPPYPTTSVLQQTGEVTFNWAPEDTVSDIYETLKSISTKSPEWETEEGIYVGMSLEDLEQLNGKPFSLFGFEWEHGGLCWFEEGKLQERSPRLGIKLEASPSKIGNDTYRQSIGKNVYQSTDEQIVALDLRVSSIRILAPKVPAVTD